MNDLKDSFRGLIKSPAVSARALARPAGTPRGRIGTMRCKGVVSIFVAISLGIPAAICAPCDFRPPDGSIEIPLPLHPLMVAPLKNACALLVTFSDNGDPAKGAIAVVQPREEIGRASCR